MSSKIRHTLVICCLVLAGFSSCRKSGASWDTNFSTPLFKTSFGIGNLIADSLLSQNPDTSLTLVYNSVLGNYTLDSLVHIPDTAVRNNYTLPFGQTILHTGDPITPGPPNNTNQTVYPLHGVGLKTAILRSGIMHINIRNRVRKKIQFNYQIPSASINGIPFSQTVMVPGSGPGGSTGVFSADYDLSGYTVDLRGLQHNSINTVITVVNANIDPNGLPGDTVTVSSNDSVVVISSFKSLVPEYAKGYFGQTIQKIGPAESPFNIFSKVSSGSILLKSVTLNFHIENSIGLDGRINIADIYSKNSRTGSTVHLNAPIVNTPININRGTETHTSPPVIASYYSQVLNNSNSNTKALLENMPDKIGYSLTLATNPLGNVSGFDDFIFYGYGMKASLDLQLPLALVANDLCLADTVAVSFNKPDSPLSRLHKCTLRLTADNGFPLDATVQLFTLDKNAKSTDSLISVPTSISAAPVDANYRATGQTETIIEFPVGETKITNLLNASKMRLVVRFNTIGKPSYIKIYSTYLINFRLSGDFDYTIKLH
ncbi:MAG TPA: hypothetical protein VGO45_02945 [Bacteroidia bacterium]|nr:hypothetical protein [Bacteroidia bacterium]